MNDLYDVEFERCLFRAKELITGMTNKEDQKICAKWVEKLIKIQTQNLEAKKNRNEFFKFMLRVLHGDALVDPFLTRPGSGPLPAYAGEEDFLQSGKPTEDKTVTMTRWSDDKRTYVSIKTIPNYGAIIYMAVSSDPALGWDIPES